MFGTSIRRPGRGLAMTALACASVLLAGCSAGTPAGADPRAASQGFIANAPGACSDPWINSVFNQAFGRAPSGSGQTGECNIGLYGGGSWGSYNHLYNLVVLSKRCQDPWVAQAVWEVKSSFLRTIPAGGSTTAGVCNTRLYGFGSWSGYADLKSKVSTALTSMERAGRTFDDYGNLVNINTHQQLVPAGQVDVVEPASNQVAPIANGKIISNDGASVLQKAGNNAIRAAGSVVACGSGNVVACGSGN